MLAYKGGKMMKELRCPNCKRKLLEVKGQAQISIKCPKCKNVILIDTTKNGN
jgi:phage FluMu protein Com